jgi:hypothetical protein
LAVLSAAVALLGALSVGLTTTAGADTGYPGTTTVTTDPGGSTSPSGGTTPSDPCAPSPGACGAGGSLPATGSGPGDPCATNSGACSSGGTAGTLAFTGADLLALVVGALFLLIMGTLLVVFSRRRAIHQRI